MKITIKISLLVILLSIVSCWDDPAKQALRMADKNRIELQKVLDHYQQLNNKEKYHAACFLIENMPFHSWETGFRQFDAAFDSIAKVPMINERREIFEQLLDSIAKIPSTDFVGVTRDIETLDANYLIENIDLAFEAWHRYPVEKRANFDTFCNFILPYRNSDEPIEQENRRNFMEKYSWVFDSLNANVSLKNIADRIINDFQYSNLTSIRGKYPITLSISQYEKSKISLCQDEVNYFVDLFRALGIASSDEYITHWGNHHASGHSWLRLEYGNEIYCEKDLRSVYKNESIPKVYRRTFAKKTTENGDTCFSLDVTTEYKTTIDTDVDIVLNRPSLRVRPALCVFDANTQWKKVADGTKNGNKFLFKNIGTNVLYLTAYSSSGQLYPVNYPFFVSLDKTVHYYKPLASTNDSIVLLRKAGFTTPRNKWKQQWLDSLNNGIFQGANNPSFHDAKIFAQISKLNSPQPQLLQVVQNQSFRYVRFYANKHESFLAFLEFLDPQKNKLQGSIIKSNNTKFIWEDGAYDDDPLTFSGGRDFSLGLKLDQAQQIGYIRFQARNDDNHIRVGDNYELFYWDKRWISLGTQTATDTLLVYKRVAKNSLLWLRNLSRGKEENIFVMDKNGKQRWLGFCNE